MTDAREIELKLDLAPSDVDRIRRKGLDRLAAAGTTAHLSTTYFDTAERDLRERGLSLRIRETDGRRVQTLKSQEGAGAGLFDRAEWERPLPGQEPDLDAAADGTPFGKLLGSKRVRRDLRPVFRVQVRRSTWAISTEAYEVEATLDLGTVEADGGSVPLAELELELKRGEPSHLFDLARALDRSCPLRLGIDTKSSRGYRLLDGGPARAAKADPVPVRPGMSAGQAFQAVARSCIRQVRANEPGIMESRDPACLHQARVGIRRLRAALKVFRPVVEDARYGGVATGLRRLGALLGEARDLDVYRAGPAQPPPPGIDPSALAAAAATAREKAYDAVVAALAARRTRMLMLDLAAWVEHGPWRGDTAPERVDLRDRPVAEFAAAILRKRRRAVRKAGKDLRVSSPAERHAVRIAGKTLRYAAEFFAGAATGGKAARRRGALLSALETLQEELGALNDREAAARLTDRLAASLAPAAESGVPAGAAAAPPPIPEADERRHLDAAQAAHAAMSEVKLFLR